MVVIEDGYVKIVWTEELKYHPLNRRNKMAAKYIHKPGKGSFINNKYKNKDSQPDYTGDCTLPDGTVQRIAVWNAVGQHSKTPYFRFEISDPRPQTQGDAAPSNAAPKPIHEMIDDIPF